MDSNCTLKSLFCRKFPGCREMRPADATQDESNPPFLTLSCEFAKLLLTNDICTCKLPVLNTYKRH